jgi:hypothetical protein
MHDNTADAMTKLLSKNLFHRHFDTYMGRRIPEYAQSPLSLMFHNQHGYDHNHNKADCMNMGGGGGVLETRT